MDVSVGSADEFCDEEADADIIYRLKNDIMEDCFLFFCCSDQQFLSSALPQQFNSLTRLSF